MRQRLWIVFLLPVLVCPRFIAVGHSQEHYLGDTSCTTSGCHGGAGDKGQSRTWAEKDYHSRAKAILLTARSQRMAETLKIPDASTSSRCLICHSPMEAASPSLLAPKVKPDQAVSCESCHGPAEKWLRSHTRSDFTHAQRIADGMRKLSSLGNRATTCVACHLNLDQDILESGHPELIFELDGQTLAQPPHWKEKNPWSGPQIWLAGQATAWREMNWQLARNPYPMLAQREAALSWLLGYLTEKVPGLPEFAPPPENQSDRENYARSYAARATAFPWNRKLAASAFEALAASGSQLTSSPELTARRAEVLVLALDRLLPAADYSPEKRGRLQTILDSLFQSVQILPEFKPVPFTTTLLELEKIP